MRNACGILHVFLGYLYRERLLPKDLSPAVESPQTYRLAKIPRSVTWEEVRRLLEAIDRRAPTGRRDYAILLLLVSQGKFRLSAQGAGAITAGQEAAGQVETGVAPPGPEVRGEF